MEKTKKSNKNKKMVIGVLILLIIICLGIIFTLTMRYQMSPNFMGGSYYNNNNNNYSSPMMGNGQISGMPNSQIQSQNNNQITGNDGLTMISQKELNLYVSQESPARVTSNNTLLFSGKNVKLVVLMGPMEEGKNMYSFIIDNLTNPNLVFEKGAKVSVIVVNVDTDAYHSFALTPYGPPYPDMIMMMNYYISTNRLAPQSSGSYESQSISFNVNNDMYYLCTVPEHAQKGMYGKISVEG